MKKTVLTSKSQNRLSEQDGATAHRPGRMVTDRQTLMIYWQGDITDTEAEEAALNANLSRHD